MVGAIALICVLPFILNLTGADFGSSAVALNLDVAASLSPQAFTDALHHALEGQLYPHPAGMERFLYGNFYRCPSLCPFQYQARCHHPGDWHGLALRWLYGCLPYLGRQPIN
jgi:hypothetical protein